MTKWLTTVKVNDLKPKSYDRLEQTLTLDVFPSIGEIQLQALTTDYVQNMINKLCADGRSHSSIKKAYDAVNACFKHGVIQRTVAFNPAPGVAVPGKSSFKQKQVPFYTKEEAQALCTQAMSSWGNGKRRYPLGAFVPLLINTGLRMGELLSLQWKRDIDLKNNIITVHANMAIVRDRSEDAKSKYKLIEQDTVKSQAGQDRSIHLNDAAIEAINDLHKATGQYTNVMTTSNGCVLSTGNPQNRKEISLLSYGEFLKNGRT
ncbi:MAG: site-specific integrase [Oscillospiraceae bacterium]|nr:site-specific integrase [Oscillospiraceae bacterium]